MSLKNQLTPPGIDPRTFRLVAQPLNHYATPGPSLRWYGVLNHKEIISKSIGSPNWKTLFFFFTSTSTSSGDSNACQLLALTDTVGGAGLGEQV